MTYSTYMQVVKDINYMDRFQAPDTGRYLSASIEYANNKDIRKIKDIWLENIKERYEDTKTKNTTLSKFLTQFPLKFKEFCCLIDLIEDRNEKSEFEIELKIGESKDIFKKHKVRYESSQLKKFKLIYKIVNPLRPMTAIYEVSYKAQLALKNSKYTDEYEQLDLVFEEEAKRNSPEQLESLYYITQPKVSFNDFISSTGLRQDLYSAIAREENKKKIFKTWGFGKMIEYGRGTTLNFRGVPGTGKTMAAHCIANHLKKKLLIVRYDQLQSMYVGQTEKHIQQVFKLAKIKEAVLFFDEADAIALKRENLSRSWEMSQVNTLLKELERFEGMCIFATNFAENYDPAFERRLTMHVDFKIPDQKQQIKIIEKMFPEKSRDKNLDFKGLELTNLTGGDIKNVALNAAGIAAKKNAKKIDRQHIEQAINIVKQTKTEKKDINYIS